MITPRQFEATKTYASLMDEVKVRVLSINTIVANPGDLPSQVVRESCYLQLRMCCELIALGCLVAHGDIKAARSAEMRKAYNAEKIIRALDELHPDFYPDPHVRTKTSANSWHITPRAEPYLTKADLLNLNNTCGTILHRGRLKNLLKPQSPMQKDFKDVISTGQKIVNLLEFHHIRLVGDIIVLCMLSSAENGGRAQVVLSEPSG